MSARYLLDTSVYSQPLRNRPVKACLQRWSGIGDEDCRTCSVAVAEIEYGLHLENRDLRWEKYRQLLVGRLPVLDIDVSVWSQFSRMKARQQTLGKQVADLDLLIAACAAHHGLIVATLNSSDFSRIEGVPWEDWSV